MDLGPHAAFIWASYAAVIVIVGALIGWVVLDGNRQARALDDADRRGLKRRSSEGRDR
jgi:heme exporter protein D